MPKVIFVDYTGQEHLIDANEGESMMEVAIDHDLPGIDADCGGNCACATCHVYVDEACFDRLPEMSDSEREMLDLAEQRRATSRLACQLTVFEGLRVTMPEEQF